MFESVTYMDSVIKKDAKTVVSFSFTKLSTIWLWFHIHLWKRVMSVPGKKHSEKFRRPYGQSFFPNSISAWMALIMTLQRPTLYIYLSQNYKVRLRQRISEHICQRIPLINEPEPEPESEPGLETFYKNIREKYSDHNKLTLEDILRNF